MRGGLLFAGKDTGSALYHTPKDTFLPRLGFAYSVDNKTVVRGGFGLFAGFLGERRGDVIQPGFTRTTGLANTTLTSGAPIPQPIANFTNITVLEPIGNTAGRQTGLGGSISFFNQNPEVSKQARFQIGFQRELPGGFVAEATYVGNYGYNIEIVRNINALPLQYLNTDNSRSAAQTANNSLLTAGVANPFFGLADFAGTNFGTSATIARSQLLRPFPQFGDIITTDNDGKSFYNSGQFIINKRFSRGYSFQASYTFSKWLQETEYLNAADEKPTRIISDQDTPHRFSMSGLYSLPFGKGQTFLSNSNGFVDRLVGGWQVQGVYNFQVGFPIAFGAYNLTTAATSGDIFYNGGAVSISSSDRSTSQYFNTGVFSYLGNSNSTLDTPVNHLRTLPYRFSNVRRDNLNNFDFSLLKDTRIRENMRIQLRFELINAFNEPYLPVPVTNQNTTVSLNGVNVPAFGTILTSTSNQDNYARRAQIGVKFLF